MLKRIWLISTLVVFALVSLIVVAPLTADSHIATSIYRGFAAFCHQLPERSYFIAGHKLAVCSRCTGVYAGFALTLLLYPLMRPLRTTDWPPPVWLVLAAVPMAIDFGLTFLGIWENTHSSQFAKKQGKAAHFHARVAGSNGLSSQRLQHSPPPDLASLSCRFVHTCLPRAEPTVPPISLYWPR